MNFVEGLFFAGCVCLLIGVACSLGYQDYKRGVRISECEKSCDIRKSKLIENACYCATEKGWEAK